MDMVNQALKDKILEVLGSEGSLSVSQLAEKLICANQKVMEAVDELDDQGLLDSSIKGSAVVYSLVNQADAKRPEKEVFKTNKEKSTVEVGASGKLATIKQMVIEVLNDFPNKTITRAQLLTALKTVSATDLDNCLQHLKAENVLHSVARGVVRLGSMSVNQAAENIEGILDVAIPHPVSASTKEINAPEQKVSFGVFDDGSMVLKLFGGTDLILSPIEAQRAHKLLNMFYGVTQA